MAAEKRHREKLLQESVTVQGLSQVLDGNSNHVRRIIWLLILCGGLAFTAFNIYTQVTLYLSVPVSIRVDQLLARRLRFPTVTICNNNFLIKSAIAGTGLISILPVVLPYADFQENISHIDVSKVDYEAIFSTDDPVASWTKITSKANETIIRCEWESGPCNLDNFTRVFTDINLCFAFNVNGSLLAKNSGRAHGFRVLLNVQQEEYVRSFKGHVSTGFMVAIHSAEVPPIMSETGIAVAPGFQHFFGVEVKIQTAKDGISGCGTRQLEFTTANYSREACRVECRGRFLVEKCNCSDLTIPNPAPFCGPLA